MCEFGQQEIVDTLRPELEPDTESITTARVANVTPLGPTVDKVFDGLGAELKALGLSIEKVKGWRDRGHPGTFEPRGVMFHHTASSKKTGNAPALGIVTFGRADLPGPLSNFVVGRDGTVFFVAAGRCYHAGEGGPLLDIPKDDGNSYLIGVECENDGVGEEWPEQQKRAIGKLFACLLRRMDAHSRMVIGHKEWAPGRKFDPNPIEMDAFRGRVRGYLHAMKEPKRGR